VYRVAAGRLPADHWLNDPADGGGRLLGEGCHFVDFACWFVGSLPIAVAAAVPRSGASVALEQRFAITLTFAGGSIATIFYGSEADTGFPKEVVEAHSTGRSAVLDDYKSLELRGDGRSRTINDRRQDKGHGAQFYAFRRRLDGAPATGPDPLDTMAVTLEALATARGE
jgi:predicted dehydrogenase